jgi:uncharacterized membrane protein YbhN (UPF0104 family)
MWKRVRVVAQIAFGVLAVGFLVWAVVKNWAGVISALAAMNPWLVLLAAALILTGLYVNMLSWRSVLASLGAHLTRTQAATVFFTSQLGKYIPGGIWPVVASARLGRAYGLTAIRSVVSMTVALLLSLTVGTVFAISALFLIPVLASQYSLLIIALLVVGLIALSPPVLNRLIRLGLKILRRDGQLPELGSAAFTRAIGWSLLSWLCFGLALFSLISAESAVTWSALLGGISGYALSWIAGFVAILVPAGVGVREAVLVLVLGGTLAGPTIFGIALVHRIFMTLGDIVMLAFTRRQRAQILAEPETTTGPGTAATTDPAEHGYLREQAAE